MTLESGVHIVSHIVQITITLIIIYYFIQNYRAIRSRFNLGLILFAVAMLFQIVFAWSLHIPLHLLSETFEIAALLIFLSLIRR
jgi:hypothetical protein